MAVQNFTPLETVLAKYKFPIDEIRPYQVETINELAPLKRSGHYLDQGLGKTLTGTICALYKMMNGADITLCLVPPILIPRWTRWIDMIPNTGAIGYFGTPKQRKKIKFDKPFIVMSLAIFKQDYDEIQKRLNGFEVVYLVDEASSIKNAGSSALKKKASENHKRVAEAIAGSNHFIALTGTPLTTPLDGYAFCKLIAPGVYRNVVHFENTHIFAKDIFGGVSKWGNLDMLAENMKVNSKRFLRQEVLKDLPDVMYDPVYYDLSDAHMALYTTLAEEQLLPLENTGGKIDATVVQRLHNCLQQIVVNYDYFSDEPSNVSNTFTLIDEIIEELAGKKLIVFAKYRMTNAKLIHALERYGAVGVYGDVSAANQIKNVDRFINDKTCQILVGNTGSLGYGVEGLQNVCHNILFVELPDTPRDFHQAVARIWRSGQNFKSHIHIAVATGTLQMRKLRLMLKKDELIGQVQRNYKDLRAEIFGN